jgi:hypothetical protein
MTQKTGFKVIQFVQNKITNKPRKVFSKKRNGKKEA